MTAAQLTYLTLLCCAAPWWPVAGWQNSEMTMEKGHYPHTLCKLTNAVFMAKDGVFYAQGDQDKVESVCRDAMAIWDIKAVRDLEGTNCDESYDTGHVFAFYYYYGTSNYYHLHYDTMMPLYKAIYHNNNDHASTRVLMPTVEAQRLKVK